MKAGQVLVVYLCAALSCACHKEAGTATLTHHQQKFSKQNTGVYVSGWEQIDSWSPDQVKGKNIYIHSRPLPVTHSDAAVLVYVKNLWTFDPLIDGAENDLPLQLPLNFVPFDDKPGTVQEWNYEIDDSKIDIQFSMADGESARFPPKNIQLQYIVLPTELIKEKNQTIDDLQQLSYDDVLMLFETSVS